MAFFSGTGDQRRRRVLAEAIAAPSGTTASDASSPSGGKTVARRRAPIYAPATLTNQPRLTDLIAQRYSRIALLFLLGGLLLAGIESLYVWSPEWAGIISPGHAAAFDLATRASLAGWFSSCALGLAAGAALVIYSVRRHKEDDYRGRYRIWIWASVCCVCFSVNTVAGLHLVLQDVITHYGVRAGWNAGSLWWLIPFGLVWAYVGLRTAIDVKACPLGLTTLVATHACWLAAVAIHFDWVKVEPAHLTVMIASGLTMGGHLLLLTSLSLYARHVILDAGGMLPSRSRKPASEKKKRNGDAEAKPAASGSVEASPTKTRQVKIDAAHATAPQSARRNDLDQSRRGKTSDARATQWVGGEDADDAYDEDDEHASGERRKLSKAERKRLRKQQSQDGQWPRR